MKMKKLLVLAFVILSVSTLSAQQISLYDSEGEPRAYIDYDKDATIFMWNGTPVAFVEKDGNALCVFGFNGSFLGWYENGVIYDKNGYAVGVREGAVNMITKMGGMKGIQKITPMRPITPMTLMQPIWKSGWSNTSLTEFLYYGKK